jgi:hypothetical protein
VYLHIQASITFVLLYVCPRHYIAVNEWAHIRECVQGTICSDRYNNSNNNICVITNSPNENNLLDDYVDLNSIISHLLLVTISQRVEYVIDNNIAIYVCVAWADRVVNENNIAVMYTLRLVLGVWLNSSLAG